MNPPAPVRTSTVLYAKDMHKLAAFYQRTLSLPQLEAEPGFIVLGDADLEVVIVRAPAAATDAIEITTPPALREHTPIKCSFLVESLAAVREHALAAGGGTKPLEAAWRWRGQLHLDGHDPEGNVVQFRQRET